MSDAASSAFSKIAAKYDAWIRIALPTYDELFGVAVELLPHPDDAEIIVADLGAGTGLFSAGVAARYPRARFELFDGSERMLEVAASRLGSLGVEAGYRVEPMQELTARDRYDAVISSLAIHHLEHDEKRALFSRIRESLRAGGVFVNVDQVRGPGRFADLYWQTWLSKVRQAGAAEATIQGSVERRREHDRDATVAEQLRWLEEAGFAADCVYKHYFVAVFLALPQDDHQPESRR